MNEQTMTNQNEVSKSNFSHAVVIGGSIAGLTAARVLTDYYERVTIIERDRLPETPDFRQGAPQARHAHTLPLRGQNILEEQFPGISDELMANGAIAINGSNEMAFFIAGGWHQVRHNSALVSMSCSRPLLETTIYRRLANHPKVQIIQEHRVSGLSVDEPGQRVTGVRLRKWRGLDPVETKLAADLVVDASGRDSRAPEWLASLGYTPPRETIINSFTGYASRLYRRPAPVGPTWKTLYIRPTSPDQTRGGAIIPIEGDRWYVTLFGVADDAPSIDETAFLEFARSLPTSHFYEAIKEAEPVSQIYGYRHTENRARHYDRLPRYLEGFLVCGDAAQILNPVYVQGITAVLLGSQALDHCLREQSQRGDITGLAKTFQTQLCQAVDEPWQLALKHDLRWPTTEVTENVPTIPEQAFALQFSPLPALASYEPAY